MDREELLEALLNTMIERFAKQSMLYEGEITNMLAENMMLKQDVEKLKGQVSDLGKINVSVDDIKKLRNFNGFNEEGKEE